MKEIKKKGKRDGQRKGSEEEEIETRKVGMKE